MRILVDTNILIDYLAKRVPYNQSAEKIVEACADNKLLGSIAAHSVSNIFYILRKVYTVDERRELLEGVCTIFEVVGIDRDKIISALNDKDFDDFEDCLQMQCALDVQADFIVTRNPDDFMKSQVKCIEPAIFVERYLK